MRASRLSGRYASSYATADRELNGSSKSDRQKGNPMKRMSCYLLAVFLFANPAFAETPFQFSILGLRAPDTPNVSGIRVSLLYGTNRSQRGLDLGLLSVSETSRLSGLALIGGISKVTTDMSNCVALSLVNWHTGRDSGLNGAFINILNDAGGAFNLGFMNVANESTLFDLGGFNMARRSRVQIGFFNVADQITGFQFGFLNMARNGFMPIFPVFNFPRR